MALGLDAFANSILTASAVATVLVHLDKFESLLQIAGVWFAASTAMQTLCQGRHRTFWPSMLVTLLCQGRVQIIRAISPSNKCLSKPLNKLLSKPSKIPASNHGRGVLCFVVMNFPYDVAGGRLE